MNCDAADAAAALPERFDHARAGRGCSAAERERPAAGGAGAEIGRSLDAVREDGVGRAVQRLSALDLDRWGPGAAEICAAGAEERAEVGDLRLTGGVFDRGAAVCAKGSQHGVFRRADAGARQAEARAVQPVRPAADSPAFFFGGRAESAECLQVIVDGTRADGAAARKRQRGRPGPGQERAEKEARGAHGACERRWDGVFRKAAPIYG